MSPLLLPVQRDAHHTQETDSNIAIEYHWEYLAECLPQCPLLHGIPHCLQGHRDGAEEQVTDAQGDDEGSGRMVAQLWTPYQCQ